MRRSEVTAEDSGYLLWLHVSVWGSKWSCSSLRQIARRSVAATHTPTRWRSFTWVCVRLCAHAAGIVLVERSGHRKRPLSLKAAVSSSEVSRRSRHRLHRHQCFQHLGYKLYVHINTDPSGLITASSSFCMLAQTGSSHCGQWFQSLMWRALQWRGPARWQRCGAAVGIWWAGRQLTSLRSAQLNAGGAEVSLREGGALLCFLDEDLRENRETRRSSKSQYERTDWFFITFSCSDCEMEKKNVAAAGL